MAYPNRIRLTGALSQENDLLDYFKGAFSAFMVDPTSTGERYDTEWWVNFRGQLNGESFPLTRTYFYNLIAVNFPLVGGTAIYNYTEPQSGWSNEMASDWGKLKSLELAIFGNINGGGSTLTKFNSTVFPNTALWTNASLTYLRYALVHFATYGSCILPTTKQPTPTGFLATTSPRGFTWTLATGIPLGDHEFQIQDYGWITATVRPVTLFSTDIINAGDIAIRVKGNSYVNPSDILYNPTAFADNPCSLSIFIDLSTAREFSVRVTLSRTLPQDLFVDVGGFYNTSSGEQPYVRDVTVVAGQIQGQNQQTTGQDIIGTPSYMIENVAPNPNGTIPILY